MESKNTAWLKHYCQPQKSSIAERSFVYITSPAPSQSHVSARLISIILITEAFISELIEILNEP